MSGTPALAVRHSEVPRAYTQSLHMPEATAHTSTALGAPALGTQHRPVRHRKGCHTQPASTLPSARSST